MTGRLKEIINRLSAIITLNPATSMTDEDFIADIDAINLLCNTCDDLCLDRSELRGNMDRLYPELLRRARGKKDIQLAMPLIKALHRYIYDRSVDSYDRGPESRRDSFIGMCREVVDSYRKKPLIHSSDYLYCLLKSSQAADSDTDLIFDECRTILGNYLKDIDSVTAEEQIRRAWAYRLSRSYVMTDPCKWIEIIGSLKFMSVKTLDDDTFLTWSDLTGELPEKETKRRSSHSLRMHVQHLRSLIASSFSTIAQENDFSQIAHTLNTSSRLKSTGKRFLRNRPRV